MAEAESEHSRRPTKSDFKQQTLPAWQPILTPCTVIASFLVIGVLFIPVGILLLVESESVQEIAFPYDGVDVSGDKKCTPMLENGVWKPVTCLVNFKINNKMEAPVYLYYQLTNYYQNHRRYVKSRSDPQLQGKYNDQLSYGNVEDCLPRIYEGDDPENQSSWYAPCGLIAWSMFNDTYELYKEDASGRTLVEMTKIGIAWESDKKVKFKNPDDWDKVDGIRSPHVDFTDEDFIVWMRTAALPHFRKLHRIINDDLDAGEFVINITSKFPVEDFKGTKAFVLSTTSWIGGRNNFLGIAYIVVGSLCVALAVVFLAVDHVHPRKLGDQMFLVNVRR